MESATSAIADRESLIKGLGLTTEREAQSVLQLDVLVYVNARFYCPTPTKYIDKVRTFICSGMLNE